MLRIITLASFAATLPAFAQTTVAHYHFEAGANGQAVSGSLFDSAGQHPFVAESGTTATFTSTVPVDTVAQSCIANARSISFNNLPGLISADSPLTAFGYNEWTIEAFVRFNSLSGFQTFIGKDAAGQAAGDVYFQRSSRTNTFFFSYRDTAGNVWGNEGGTSIQANRWYHVAAVKSANALTLYIDGAPQWTVNGATLQIRNGGPWTIGRGWFNNGAADQSNAIIDEVRFSSVALAPGQFLRDTGPTIFRHPAPSTVCPNGSTSFTVVPAGTGPFTYQWRGDGTPITTESNSSATGATLFISNISIFDAMNYDCIVTNSCGSITSDSAHLTVCAADFNCDSTVDFFDYLDFVNNFSVQTTRADFNQDGVIDFFDYLDFVQVFSAAC